MNCIQAVAGTIMLPLAFMTLKLQAETSPILLRPPSTLVAGEAAQAVPVLFYQAVPLKEGDLRLKAPSVAYLSQESLASVHPVAYWPDGSIRWLGVEGVLAGKDIKHFDDENGLPLTLSSDFKNDKKGSPSRKVEWNENTIIIKDEKGKTLFSLSPSASIVTITRPKQAQPTDPDYLDSKGQYSWAAPLQELGDDTTPHPLPLEIREGAVERETPIYTLYRIRGTGGGGSPGNLLEWQLRLRCYHGVPVVRMELTWMVNWNAEKYALASAKLSIRGAALLKKAEVLNEAEPIDLERQTLAVISDANGANRIEVSGKMINERAMPSRGQEAMLVESAGHPWALAVPNLHRLGPNHLSASNEAVEVASWTDHTGLALDLRRSSESDEDFGLRSVDLATNGAGLARTFEASLIFSESQEWNKAFAKRECLQEGIWLPSSRDLEKTGVFGPFSRETLAENKDYFDGLRANLHFLLASREHWRWNGFVNFGDYRTNFALGTVPNKGLNAGRWALFGRYGWRNGSGGGYGYLVQAALMLDDRSLALAALDFARHVADIDVRHRSFWKPGGSGKEGGMHRRNRDHWSGSEQMQYTPTRGLYFANWLTGSDRIGDVLIENREFATRDRSQQGALCYAARTWLYHYIETQDVNSLETAKGLLEQASVYWCANSSWMQKSPNYPLGSLYFENITRRTGEGVSILIDFYEATGDRIYLDTLLEMAKHDSLPANPSPGLEQHYLLGYLLSNGVQPKDIGEELLRKASKQVAEFKPGPLPDSTAWNYETLVEIVTKQLPPAGSPGYRESAAIAQRALCCFLALKHFGNTKDATEKPQLPVAN